MSFIDTFEDFLETLRGEHSDIYSDLTNKEKILISKAIEYVKKNAEKQTIIHVGMFKNEEYFSIKEVSEDLDVPTGTLRQWENDLAGIITIPRDSNGSRVYTEKEIKILRNIRDMRKMNMSIQQIRIEILAAKEQGDIDDLKKTIESKEESIEKIEKMSQDTCKREYIPAKLRLEILNESARYVETEDAYIPSCRFCGKTSSESTLHIDHIIPCSKGGKTEKENLQVLCSQCNIQKSNKYELIINKEVVNYDGGDAIAR